MYKCKFTFSKEVLAVATTYCIKSLIVYPKINVQGPSKRQLSISFIFNKNFTRLPCRTTKDKRRHIFKKVVIVLGKAKTDFGFKSSFVSFSQQKEKKSFGTHAKKKTEISCWILHEKSSLKFPSTFPVDFC